MNGFINMLTDNALHDFQKSGYFNNIRTALPIAPDGYLLPFFRVHDDTGNEDTVSEFKLQAVDKKGNAAETLDLTTSWVTVSDNGSKVVIYYNADHDILDSLDEYSDSIYRYRVKMSDGSIYYSEHFQINDFKFTTVIGGSGEFSDDFGGDFAIGGGILPGGGSGT